MAGNQFGNRWTITTFGESHGNGLGVVIDGCPSGIEYDQDLLHKEMARRRPGSDKKVVSGRNEADLPEILSGVYQGKTLGTPIALVVKNKDARSDDYKDLPDRPGHADDVWRTKFGHKDPRGGGRTSGRETLSRVIGGAFAQMYLKKVMPDLQLLGAVTQIGPVVWKFGDNYLDSFLKDAGSMAATVCSMPTNQLNKDAEILLEAAKNEGRSYGGEVTLVARGVSVGLGQPVFKKLKSEIAAAVMSVGACYSVEIGAPFDVADEEGAEFHRKAISDSEVYGGIRGGISTGEPIIIRAKFKPTSTVLDVAKKGRHDPCIVPRALPVVENMLYMVLADHHLMSLGENESNS